MCIRQPQHGYGCGQKTHAKGFAELKGASAIAAVVVHNTAIQFGRLLSLHRAIAGLLHSGIDQPSVLVVMVILSAIKLAASLCQHRNRPDPLRKGEELKHKQS
jgi:hypothetical protein